MLHRRRSNASLILEFYLEKEAVNLRKQAEGMPLSIRRDELLRKANQAETTVQVSNGSRIPDRSITRPENQ
jgi:hypothetical protein